jgi:hypothetical protein
VNSAVGVVGENYAIMRNGYPLVNLPLIQANLDPTITILPSDPAPEAGDDISNHELLSQGGGLR